MVGRPQDIFHFLIPFHLGDISAGLAILTYFLGTQQSRENVVLFPEFRLFLMFCVIAALCIPFGYYPRAGVQFLWDFFLKFGAYLYLFGKLITDQKHFQGIISTLFICGLIMAMAAVSVMTAGIRTQVIGSAYDPNDLGLLVVTTIPIAITQGLSTRNRLWKMVFFGGSALFVVTLIGTQSRGGFLGLVAATVSFFLTKTPGFSKRNLLALFTGLAVLFAVYVGAEYKERLDTLFEDVSSLEAGSGRILVWKRAITIAGDNPILGVGPRAFGTAYGDYLSNDKFSGETSVREESHAPYAWKAIHNSYLQVLVELGIPGFLMLLAIIIRCFRNLRQAQTVVQQKWGKNALFQVSGIKIAFVGFLTCAFFLTHGYSAFPWIFLFLSGAMLRSYGNVQLDRNSHVRQTR